MGESTAGARRKVKHGDEWSEQYRPEHDVKRLPWRSLFHFIFSFRITWRRLEHDVKLSQSIEKFAKKGIMLKRVQAHISTMETQQVFLQRGWTNSLDTFVHLRGIQGQENSR